MSDEDTYVWRVTKVADEIPRIEIGTVLDGLDPKEYLPHVAEALAQLSTFLFKICLSGLEEEEVEYE